MKHIKSKPKGTTKFVRINSQTLIEVEMSISDEAAKESYLRKLKRNKPNLRQIQEDAHIIRNRLLTY